MRTSISLTSFFSSLRSPISSSHLLIPIIRIISPLDTSPPRLSTGPGGIRRWRGALGTLGDLTLQLPSQGLTSGARLALARQGCASGSFRMNCEESLYVRDSRGLAMFQRIELEEELEKARLGLRERPPMLASSRQSDKEEGESMDVSDRAWRRHRDRRSPMNSRTYKRNVLASQNLRFDSGGLSSCATFTEGLCNLEDYMRSADTNSSIAGIPTFYSAKDISQLASAPNDNWSMPWLNSLKRKAFTTTENQARMKKRRSAGEIARSLSCINFDVSFSESDLTLTIDIASPALDDSSKAMDAPLKRSTYTSEEDVEKATPAPLKRLSREGSWSRLRRKFSGRVSALQLDFSTNRRSDDFTNVGRDLYQILEQDTATTCVEALDACA